MKFSQNITSQEIVPSDAKVNWYDNGDHLWLPISNGLIVTKKADGSGTSLKINNSHNSTSGGHTGHLFNSTMGIVTSITLGMHVVIELDQKCHYVLTLNNISSTPDKKCFILETLVLEFEPE